MTYGPPIPYMECGNLVTVNDSSGPPVPYMECGNLVTFNDSYGPPHLKWNVGTLKLSMTDGPPVIIMK